MCFNDITFQFYSEFLAGTNIRGVMNQLHGYARFLSNINRPRAPGWGKGFFGPYNLYWVGVVYRYTEDEVLAVAGWDSVVYLRILRFGASIHPPSQPSISAGL